MSNSNLTQTVVDIGNINLSGNITPREWFKHITLENGKPDAIAIILLSEIVFLYRPTRIHDERTDEIIYKKKFHADLLQKSYSSLAKTFGFTKRQVTDSIIRLEKGGFLTRIFRTVTKTEGDLYNVLFIDLHAEAIKKITDLGKNLAPPPSGDLPRFNVTPPHLKRETNTENTTYIKDKNIKKNLNEDFKGFWDAYPKRIGKIAAERAFKKALKVTDVETILKSVKLYSAKLKRDNVEDKYQSNPASWLNGERWEDEYSSGTKTEAPNPANFKKRNGVDKTICDILLDKMVVADFFNWVESPKTFFSRTRFDKKLKASFGTMFIKEQFLERFHSHIKEAGYEILTFDIAK